MKTKRITTAALGLVTVLANAQMRPTRQHFVVPLEAVARTIATTFAARGIQVSADQIKLPTAVLAKEEEPLLEVSSVDQLGQLSAAQPDQISAGVRLRCKAIGTCMPFYAIVTWQEAHQSLAASNNTIAAQAKPREERSTPIIKAGERLTLIMEGDHARIQVAVISLGSASLGQRIRVATPDRKHFYMAEVLGEGAVKGSF